MSSSGSRAFAAVEKVAVFLNVAAALGLVWVTYLTYRSSNREETLFEEQVKLVNKAVGASAALADSAQKHATLFTDEIKLAKEQALRLDKLYFEWVMDQAEKGCRACLSCAPDPAMRRYLETAARLESRLRDLLTAADYNAMAAMGSSLWEFSQLEGYCQEALRRSKTPQDKFYSNLVLGHLHFQNTGGDPKADVLNGRKFFKEAVDVLVTAPPTQNNQHLLGYAHALRALWEIVFNNQKDADQNETLARGYWRKLPSRQSLEEELTKAVKAGKEGLRPQVPCLPRPPQTVVPPPSVTYAESEPPRTPTPAIPLEPPDIAPPPIVPAPPHEAPTVAPKEPTPSRRGALRQTLDPTLEPPIPVIARLVLNNQTGAEQRLLVNGVPHLAALGVTELFVPYGVVNVQFSKFGPIWQWDVSRWKWTGSNYRLEIPIILQHSKPDALGGTGS